MLSQALDTHYRLEKPKDRDWLHILLSFLKSYVHDLGEALLMHEEDKASYVNDLVAAMKTSADDLDSGGSVLSLPQCIDLIEHLQTWTIPIIQC